MLVFLWLEGPYNDRPDLLGLSLCAVLAPCLVLTLCLV